jgi:hypothetical protein
MRLDEIKKSYITIDSNVKLCYTYETGGGYFYGRLLGQVVGRCCARLFSVPRVSGFTFSVVAVQSIKSRRSV